MSLGMMGALGGLGSGLVNEAAVMEREEVANADMGRRKSFEQWLMQARDEFAVKAEGRAETRTIAAEGRRTQADIAKDERDFENRKRRAPTEREMKVADETASAKGKLSFETDNLGTLVQNKGALTEAGQTDTARREGEARARVGEATADDIERNGKRAIRMDPVLKEQIDALDKEISDKASKISAAKTSGAWTTAKDKDGKEVSGTPEQRAEESQLVAMRLQRQALYARASAGRGAGDAPPDPQGLRKAAAKPDPLGLDPKPADSPASQPGRGSMQKVSTRSTDEEMDMDRTYNAEYQKQLGYLAAAKTPEEQARARTDLDSIKREAARAGVTLREPEGGQPMQASPTPAAGGMMGPPTSLMTPNATNIKSAPPGGVVLQGGKYVAPGGAPAAAASPAAASSDPTEALGQEVDTLRKEYRDLSEPSKRPGLAAGAPAREDYARKVQSLKEKIRAAEERYQRAVGGGNAAMRYPSPI